MKSMIMKHKKVGNTTFLLVFFDDHGTQKYSVGERHNYSIPKDRVIDYWSRAEYYHLHELDEALLHFDNAVASEQKRWLPIKTGVTL